ncbi:hypothetical protein C0991_002223 [Blastosporella zonata]|nr:hypothetical protein C0991_002223 [Blastosporella zonata]
MFAKLPQRFAAPFSILGDEAKLAFPSQSGGIAKLATTRPRTQHIPETDSYWQQVRAWFNMSLVSTINAIAYSVLRSVRFSIGRILSHYPAPQLETHSPGSVRRALLDAPENVATLIRVVSVRLFTLLTDHTFPSSSNASVAAFASSFINPGHSDRNTTKEVLNCLRILQRVLPVVFEVDGELNTFELEVLWKKEEIEVDGEGSATVDNAENPQFVIEDDDDSDVERDEPSPKIAQLKPKQKRQLPSLGEKLFSTTMDLLFCCGFTLPISIQVDHHKINYVIWYVRRSVFDIETNAFQGKRELDLRRTLDQVILMMATERKFCGSCSSSFLAKYISLLVRSSPTPLSTAYTSYKRYPAEMS